MVEANIKIIAELKLVLEEITNNALVRELFTTSKNDFIRERKLGIQRLISLVINLPKRSLSVELKDFFEVIGDPMPATKGAFSLQRTKLLPLFFQVWNQFLVNSFYKHYGLEAKRWNGFRLLAVDGSTAYLIDKPDVVAYFGTQINQFVEVPMARIMQVYDILNDMIVLSGIYPIKTSEQSILVSQIENIYEDSISIYDRGFPSYEFMFLMNNQEVMRKFVIRCKTTFNKEVIAFVAGKENSKIVYIKPTKNTIRKLYAKGYKVTEETDIEIRLVKVILPSGEIEVLLTNLYDEDLYSHADLKYLYGLRWGIETSYGMQKNNLQIEQFSGHRVICIQQDYAASVFVANLQSLVSKQCENHIEQKNKTRKFKYKINKNISIAIVKNNIVRLFLDNEPQKILLKMQHLFESNIEPIRPGRKYKRVLKAKHKGKYRTLSNYKRAV